jgi:hypothetical protein
MLPKPDLNKPVFKLYPYKKTLAMRGLCTFCSKPIAEESFRSDLGRKEYTVTGMCQLCQDNAFRRAAFGG